MSKKLRYDKNINKDVVLCETTNHRVSNVTSKALVNDSIPFSKRWKHIPFFKRNDYNGAAKVCIIKINRNEYTKARRCLDDIDSFYKDRLLLNII
ncbi:MAG: hypothetical protein K5644_09145 [Lachnospiraceae bacterium]|nr:hypothetical protein [Lachnospiraceae bacterium]